MNVQTSTRTYFQVSDEAEKIVAFGLEHHRRFRIIPDFRGVIDKPVFNSTGDWLYSPFTEADEFIIPKAAFKRHEDVVKAGFRVAQVIIGHEIVDVPELPYSTPSSMPEIDWANVAKVLGTGVVAGVASLAILPLAVLTTAAAALAGLALLADPSYCIVLKENDNPGTVIELMRWSTEAKYAKSSNLR